MAPLSPSKLSLISYDDKSNKERVQELYTRLATEDNADLMNSPYSSGLTSAASIIAEQYGKIMITTSAAGYQSLRGYLPTSPFFKNIQSNPKVIEAYLGDPKLAEKLMQQANE